MLDLSKLPPEFRDEAAVLLETDPEFRDWQQQFLGDAETNGYYQFQPRPDKPELFDQQHSYVYAKDSVSFLMGGNGCLAPWERLYDPTTGLERPIAELRQPSHVWSMDAAGNRRLGMAGPAFCKGTMRRLRVTLSTGETFVCSAGHRVLLASGVWARIGDLRRGLALKRPFPLELPSRVSSGQWLPQDAGRWFQTPSSFPGHCSRDLRRYGERLRFSSEAAQGLSRQLTDALARSPNDSLRDDREGAQERSRSYRPCDRRSTPRYACPALPSYASQNQTACKPCSRFLSLDGTRARERFASTPAILQSTTRLQFPLGSFRPSHTFPSFAQEATETLCLTRDCAFIQRECENASIIAAIEEIGNGEVWDLSVWPWANYEHAGVIHHNSGKTACSALKCANFLMTTPPPRPNTPFWIIAQTYDQSCLVCWEEKLLNCGFLPKTEINFDGITHFRGSLPRAVPLKPWPKDRKGAKEGCNWVLEFKSCEQGRGALQARSIAGFWFSEQFPLEVFLETLRGCREYMYPGGQFCEFTPIDPTLCLWIESLMDETPEGYGFYRSNTAQNVALAEGWYDKFFSAVPEEMLATRQTGALASFEGVIFESFSPSVHVKEFEIPKGAQHNLGTDWGSSTEHPHATVWFCKDAIGTVWVYDEYWCPDNDKITLDHIEAIITRCDGWGWPCDKIRDRKTRDWRTVLAGDDPLYGLNYADPSRPGEINEFNFWGIPTAGALNDVHRGIDHVRSLLKVRPPKDRPFLFIHKRCQRLIQEMRKYRWLRGAKSNARNPKVAALAPLMKDEDLVCALRYGLYSTEKMRGAGISSSSQAPADIRRRSVQFKAKEAAEAARTNGSGPEQGFFRRH